VNIKWNKAADIKFMDVIIKKKRQIPGVGHYKDKALEKPWLMCSNGVYIPRIRRGM